LRQGDDFRATRFRVLDGTERIWGLREGVGYPSWMYLDCGDCGVWVFGGAKNQENIAKFVEERWAFTPFTDNSWFTDIVRTMGEAAYRAVIDIVGTQRTPTFMIGYSLGGCVAYYLSYKLREIAQQTTCIYTYGSPRPGGVAAQTETARALVKRYYRIADPVRALPPHFDEAYSLWPMINQSTRNKWNAQVQAIGGFCIDDGGVITEEEDKSPETGGTALLSAARYYLGLETDFSSIHSIAEYDRVIQRGPDPIYTGPTNVSRPRAETPDNPTPAQERQAIQIGVAIQQEAAANPPPGRVIQMTQQPATQSNAFHARHRDRIWTVEQDGVVVDVGPGKRAAKRKSRYYNKAMRGS